MALTLSWESLDFLPRLIDSTLTWADAFILLDTGSRDGSRDYIRTRALADRRITLLTVDTDEHTFNRGRCLNLVLEHIDNSALRPLWLGVIDCDEIFEDDFARRRLPAIKRLPRVYNEISFERPNLWYSETMARAEGLHLTYREPAFQKWRRGFRYPESVFHMSRSMHDVSVVYYSTAYLLHFELRDVERSRQQFERLKLIDREWSDLLRQPDDPPPLRRLVPSEDRIDVAPSLASVSADVLLGIRGRVKIGPRVRGLLARTLGRKPG